MNTKDAIRSSMNMSDTVMKIYLSDLSDADLMTRPSSGSNHLAWQLGHLISSEVMLLKSLVPDANVELPAGFAEAHSKEQAGNDDASAFSSKEEYLSLYDKVRDASRAALEDYPEPDFDSPSAEHFRQNFPTQGDVFLLIANHPLMHAGQFAVTRRNLGKPVLI
ncbi:MAG: DinB family protein [Planctomycetaceae bacterium]|nr:DinB family protein [Planctomycetaceae bacterium]